jgi:adenosylmethionine-8-amino-7-oxononanoate aminotransferase
MRRKGWNHHLELDSVAFTKEEDIYMSNATSMNDHIFYRNLKKHYPTVDRGEGIYIYDTQGKQYLDGSGGAAVVGIGHRVKEITEAMIEQAG